MKVWKILMIIFCFFGFGNLFAEDTTATVDGEAGSVITEANANAVGGQELFRQRCSSCHRIGKGKLVGPDLIDIHERREMDWIINFVQNSAAMIEAGNPDAIEVYNQNNQIPMPPNLDLSEEEVQTIIDYIIQESESGGVSVDETEAGGGTSMQDDVKKAMAPQMKPTDFHFRLIYWISVIIIMGMAAGAVLMISMWSKGDEENVEDLNL